MAARSLVFAVLVAVNAIVYASWFWLRDADLKGNARDPYLEARYFADGPTTRVLQSSTFRNDGYVEAYFRMLESENRILVFGTSESVHHHNIANQINVLQQSPPKFEMYAQPGLSPIHLAVFIAKCKAGGIRLPAMAMVVNLVYFTESHDVVNDGWLTNVLPSDNFLQMNHGHVMEHLPEDVAEIYEDHFESRRWLTPLTMQKYLGSLLFLRFHQPNPVAPAPDASPEQRYEFKGNTHEYDTQRNVWQGYRASDELQKSRWEVKPPDECLNLAGLKAVIELVEQTEAPLLLIVTPPNKQFYAANGLDMDLYNRRYAEIRKRIKESIGSTMVIDMYDQPQLEYGYQDRMHPDAWGDRQMAEFVVGTPEFRSFHRKAAEYYASLRESPATGGE